MSKVKYILLLISLFIIAAVLYVSVDSHKISGQHFPGNVVKAETVWEVDKKDSGSCVTGIVRWEQASRETDTVMLIRTHGTRYQVIAAGLVIYDSVKGDGGALSMIDIPVCSGLQVRFDGVAASSIRTVKQSEIYVGDRLGMYMYLIRSNIYVFIFAIAALIFGIISIVIGLYMRSAWIRERCAALVSLGVYILTAGLWVVTDSNLFLIFTRRTGFVELISFLSFFGLPIALLEFTEKMLPENGKVFRVLQNTFILMLILYSVNYIWMVVPLLAIIAAEHAFMAMAIVFVVKSCIQSFRKHTDPKLIRVMLGYVAFSVCSICALVFFYLGNTRGYSISYMIGILMFVFFLADAACILVYEQIRENANLEVYTRMAYKDMMTELGNRAALREEQKQAADHRGSYAYIMIDANNLKTINDTYGHQKGDELLIEIANCIRTGVDGRGHCYRIGGDEFVVSLTGVTEDEVRGCIAAIQKEVESADQRSDIVISAAMGYAWTSVMDQDVQELLEQADAAMYENKTAMKRME